MKESLCNALEGANKRNREYREQIERLQEQLKEANDVIISVAVMPRFPVNPELCREYLKKWGVK